MKIYLDNAATTFPKPPEVYTSMMNYMTNIGTNPGRGASTASLAGNKVILNCRYALMDFFHFDKVENVIFTPNITTSLNTLIKSVVKQGWHVITSSMDHNATLRPLNSLCQKGIIELDIVPCSKEGLINIDDFINAIKPNTKLVVLSHASNIIGTIQPLEAIGKICKEKGIYFVIDAAQTAGVLPLDFYKLNCNALAFTGHKSLLGPQGIGGFLIDDNLNKQCSTFIEGGTGSLSSSIIQPDFLPDKFESGTLNGPGVAGLLEGINFINTQGLDTIREHEEYLCENFISGLLNINSIEVYGLRDTTKRVAAISVNSTKIDNSELGFILDTQYGITTRTGLHCAPLAHETVGTYPTGSLRFGIGPFNDIKDINYTLSSLNSIIRKV
ncbi:aminotransferase class V-fold PLP-dependent enzyme [Clostridium tagluense]|uniref:aminotransferase class V-fold PLP-dependent enzyme n=1 Tax=Clostridium tagluense TaxID=360422 RepID=UPI001CF5E85B|nr:aminotransferase class V-fold PLP-dependent enzyme [Clostridium tagluense]MCB2313133.1 aminotransferase class V-fold PLP-dependent enzyme [Clostridium tagluense]MCB2317899.1 aminotransferase class V-fold PLP-dependent enzyme [Clostridium tagluense]MCB2322684.1 aminotransferase class V-fold PLP-dependent enzyme [Clostridium tagluense]MCB2327662.1 aminotransferase class V-fold PLP-dependent enzyme [Clostridium tagluense]MCB2332329.1 aminotransferase class V-fold PLP-dependent enzyme [Clostrid